MVQADGAILGENCGNAVEIQSTLTSSQKPTRSAIGARTLIDPGVARMRLAVDDIVIELDAMRTFEVLCGTRGFLEEIETRIGKREVVIAHAIAA
jgi:hypothetical protein